MNTPWMADVCRKLKKNNKILFSRDSRCLEELLALIRRQKHRTLVMWAFECVETPLCVLREHYPSETRPDKAVAMCRLWAAGDMKMPPAKKALLSAHSVAKDISDPADIALCHAVGQACATVHVETHAIGLPIYELTAIVRTYGLDNCREPVEARIVQYMSCLKRWESDIDSADLKWADFLLDDSKPNKEQLLHEHIRL